MINDKKTQNEKILHALNKGMTLTPLSALRVAGTFKLSSRCGEIEKDYGIKILRKWVKRNGKRFMSYRL